MNTQPQLSHDKKEKLTRRSERLLNEVEAFGEQLHKSGIHPDNFTREMATQIEKIIKAIANA